MHDWHLKIYLKSGNIVKGTVTCRSDRSDKVAKELFKQCPEGVTIAIKGESGSDLFLIQSYIEAFEIDCKPIE